MEFANYIGAGLAVGLSGIGVAIGQGMLAKASVEVMAKRKELVSFFLTVTILGIALVESAVIYGLVIAFQLMDKEGISLVASIGIGLSVGLTGLGAGWGEGQLIAGALRSMGDNPEMKGKLMTFMVLFVALVESAAIYGLVIAFKILGSNNLDSSESFLGMGLAIGLSGMGVAIGMGLLVDKTMNYMARRADLLGLFLTITILGIALIESAAIYGLVVAFNIESKNLPLYASLGAGFAVGLAGFGVGIGAGKLGGGAVASLSRNPSIKGKTITFMVLFVALIEVVAIYGLIIAFSISGKDFSVVKDSINFLSAGLAVGLAGLGVGSGIGILTDESLKTMGKNPKMITFLLTISILGVALVESAVIYALVISFQILGSEGLHGLASLGAGLAIGLAGLGVGIGIGTLIKGSIKAINKNPELRGKILAFMILFVALVEVVAIYGLIIAFQVISKK